MKRFGSTVVGGFFLAAFLAAPATATNFAQPGTVNYAEGQVLIAGQSLDGNPAGSVQLETNESISTGNGAAEILLAPGVIVRIASDSSLTLVSSDPSDTEIRLKSGRAITEVAKIGKDNRLVIDEDGTPIRILKAGLYDFDADVRQFRVFDGQAVAQVEGRPFNVTGGHEITLNVPADVQKFKEAAHNDKFYQWSSMRSEYLAKANLDIARSDESRGYEWRRAGWYFDPWYGAYTFLPSDGIFRSPFGWDYYSAASIDLAPLGRYGHSYRRFDPYGAAASPTPANS